MFAFRATKPVDLFNADEPIGGSVNDTYIRKRAAEADRIVVAWGSFERYRWPRLQARRAEVLELLAGKPLFCLGCALDGQPRHPLYLPKNTALEPYPPPKETPL